MVQIKLERFGEDTRQLLRMWSNLTNDLVPGLGDVTFGSWPRKSWCAEITGPDPRYKFARRFLKANVDYSEANGVGSRGIFAYYNLEEGHIYDISSQINWKRVDRYYARAGKDRLVQMSEEEVRECLSAHSE